MQPFGQFWLVDFRCIVASLRWIFLKRFDHWSWGPHSSRNDCPFAHSTKERTEKVAFFSNTKSQETTPTPTKSPSHGIKRQIKTRLRERGASIRAAINHDSAENWSRQQKRGFIAAEDGFHKNLLSLTCSWWLKSFSKDSEIMSN